MNHLWTWPEDLILKPYCNMAGSEGMRARLAVIDLGARGYRRTGAAVEKRIRWLRNKSTYDPRYAGFERPVVP